jgi:hypothetical protein
MHTIADKLPIETQTLTKLLKLTTIALPPRRMVSVFLGAKMKANCFRPARLVMRLMTQCLEGFVGGQGGAIVYTTDFEGRNDGEESTPACEVVTTDDGMLRFLNEGYLFVQLPDERVVIELRTANAGGGDVSCRVEIQMHGDASEFFRRWSAYSRTHNYLQGRAAFADGEPIIHSRRYSWEDVILPEQARRQLTTHIQTFLNNTKRLRLAGMKCRRGLILSGPPGTGKTLVGKVLADTLGVSFLWVLPRHVRSALSVLEIVEAARFLSPAVVLFEDIDLIGEDRDAGQPLLLGELMNQLDGVNDNDGLVTIATTNRLQVVEKALRNRPGRFDRVVEIGLPDEHCRRLLLQKLLASAKISDTDLAALASHTGGYSGAQLEELVNTMHLFAAEGSSNGDRLLVGKSLIEAALADLNVEQKRPIGFGRG